MIFMQVGIGYTVHEHWPIIFKVLRLWNTTL